MLANTRQANKKNRANTNTGNRYDLYMQIQIHTQINKDKNSILCTVI